MFTIDPLWIYIAVPTALVSVLVLIRLRQEKMAKHAETTFKEEDLEKARPLEEKHAKRDRLVQGEEKKTPAKPKTVEEKGTPECPHYLGYLYMKRGKDNTYIPSECYGCRKLLQCLYSPNVIEKVYGE